MQLLTKTLEEITYEALHNMPTVTDNNGEVIDYVDIDNFKDYAIELINEVLATLLQQQRMVISLDRILDKLRYPYIAQFNKEPK